MRINLKYWNYHYKMKLKKLNVFNFFKTSFVKILIYKIYINFKKYNLMTDKLVTEFKGNHIFEIKMKEYFFFFFKKNKIKIVDV